MKSLTAFMAVAAVAVLMVLLATPAIADDVYCNDFAPCPDPWGHYHCINESLNSNVILDGDIEPDINCQISGGVTINGNIVGRGTARALSVYGNVNGKIEGKIVSVAVFNQGSVGDIDLSRAWRIHALNGGVARNIRGTVELVIIRDGGTADNVDVTTEDFFPGPGYPEGVEIRLASGQVYNGNVSENGPGYVKIWMEQGSEFNGNVSEKGEGDLDFYNAPGDAILNGNIKEEGDGVCHNYIANFNGNEECDD